MGGEKGGDAPGGTVGSQQHSMACLSIKFAIVQPEKLGLHRHLDFACGP